MAQSILPPDVRQQARQTHGGGIGAGVRENQVAAQSREAAVRPQVSPPVEDAPKEAAPEKEADTEKRRCRQPGCAAPAEGGWDFCPHCGSNLLRGGAAKQLGIEFSDKDVEDYLFRGYIVREAKLLGNRRMTLKSAQTKDMRAVDQFLMNGSWSKDAKGDEARVSDFYLRQMNAVCMTAACLMKVDGQSIGETMEARVEWIEERGAALADIVANKVALFNQAITEFLNEVDNVSGS